MIQKLGNAMKKMAQRSMWRGNRDDAHAIESHGMYGLRSNLNSGNDTSHAPTNTPTPAGSGNSMHLKSTNTTTTKAVVKNDDTKSGLGGSIIDALK
jgi:hypothetical protein